MLPVISQQPGRPLDETGGAGSNLDTAPILIIVLRSPRSGSWEQGTLPLVLVLLTPPTEDRSRGGNPLNVELLHRKNAQHDEDRHDCKLSNQERRLFLRRS